MRRPWRSLAVALLAVGVIVAGYVPTTHGAYTATFVHPTDTVTTSPSYNRTTFPMRDSFAGGQAGWTTYNGCWSTQTTFGYGKFLETCGGTGGPKAVTGNPAWTDYTVQADVQVNEGTQAGLLARVTSPASGTDAMNAYYAAVDLSDNSLFIGRMRNGSYTPSLARTSIPGTLALGQFYHLVVQVSGCTVTAWQTTVGANSWTRATFTDPASTCLTAGAVGLRNQDSKAGYRFFTATSGAPAASVSTTPYNSTFSTASFNDGPAAATYGGSWSFDQQAETLANTADQGVGDKQVLNRSWGDLTLTGDVRLMREPTGSIDAGFITRVTNPGSGVDDLRGFSAGISGTALVVGQHDAGRWIPGATTPLPRDVRRGEWWHITVAVVGCVVTATASPSAGGTVVQASKDFGSCTTTSGAVGVREHLVEAQWRNLAVTPR
ncbi:hypothetical protein [Curtobacterium sp. MWU13-2055]|uniref:hypothetical protein n=1 Tax=Curtobacterium sp. MWU13-2055 TaxID=2931928 RepID=UPI00200F36BB|nr:hypothetical protein [Curtobacterium sp. MWU13-2055]